MIAMLARTAKFFRPRSNLKRERFEVEFFESPLSEAKTDQVSKGVSDYVHVFAREISSLNAPAHLYGQWDNRRKEAR